MSKNKVPLEFCTVEDPLDEFLRLESMKKTKPSKMNVYEVWMEGFAATDDRSGASFEGVF